MRLLIIGGGAIGVFLAARLTEARASVALAARPRTAAAAAARGGVLLVEADGREKMLSLPVHPSVAAAFGAKSGYDLVILAVKSYHTEAAGAELLQAGAGGLPLLSVQNGVGNEEALARIVSVSPILAGVLTTPVEVLGPAHIKIARPSFKLGLAAGPRASSVSSIAALLKAAGFSVTAYEDYRALKWSKLLMNILANAQAAILGYTPAQIFAHPQLGNLELRAWREALAVMRALGVTPASVGGYPIPLAGRMVQSLHLGLMRPLFARFIVGGRGEKMPSLYYDLHPQRRQHSEINWLNGAVAREGRRLGVPTPVNATFARVLQALIDGKAQGADWAGRADRLLAEVAASDKI